MTYLVGFFGSLTDIVGSIISRNTLERVAWLLFGC